MKVECDNCGDVTTQDNLLPLEEAKDLSMRLDAGSEIPAGECLECGAFSYIKEENSERIEREIERIKTESREYFRSNKSCYE